MNLNLAGKLSTGILLATLAAGSALAQIPNVVQHVQDKMGGVQQQKKAASDAALAGNSASGTSTAKAPAGKPAASTAAKTSPPATAKPVASPTQQKAAAAQTSKAAPPARHDPFAKAAAPKSAPKPADPKTAAPNLAEGKTAPAKASQARSANTKAAEDASAGSKAADNKTADIKTADAKSDSKDEPSEQKKGGYITAGNRRDPFVSPIVQHMGGSGCSTGKRCLAIDQIALRGIVKSEAGMIAVVVNSLDKAYFLRENDPVFNGYVLKISGDTVVFKETVQDKLGHLSTREVVKKITTPAV